MSLSSLPESVQNQEPAKKVQSHLQEYEKADSPQGKQQALEQANQQASQIDTEKLADDQKKEVEEFKQSIEGELKGLQKKVQREEKKKQKEEERDAKEKAKEEKEKQNGQPQSPEAPPVPPAEQPLPGPAASPNINWTWNPFIATQRMFADLKHRKLFGDWVSGGGPKNLIENPRTNKIGEGIDASIDTLTPKAEKGKGVAGVIDKIIHYANPMTWIGQNKK